MTAKKIIIAAVSVVLIAAIVLVLGLDSKTVTGELYTAVEDKNKNAPVVTFEEPTAVAQNEKLELIYDPVEVRLNINDKATGEMLWSTGVTEDEYCEEIKNKLTAKALKQLVNVKYTDFGMKNGAENNLSDKCETTLRSIDNGLRFDFNFSKYKIRLSLEFTLTDKGISVFMPRNAVIESGSYKITGVDLLPMFGASLSSQDGYLFVPDGSGAIYNFGESKSEDNVLTLDIYDSMLANLDKLEANGEMGVQKVSAPVFGVKHPGKLLFANITEGEENCSLTMQTDTGVYKVNRIYPAVRFRKQYTMVPSSGVEISAFEKESYVSDIRIDYSVITGEDVGYSEMAASYREYLKDKGYIKYAEGEAESYPAAVDFLVNMQKDTMLYKENIVTASFDEINTMLSELGNAGVSIEKTMLYGWQKSGYYQYPAASKISSSAGGKKELLNLIEANPATKFFLLANYLNADADSKGFSTYKDVVYKIDSVPLTNESEDKYLLNLLTQSDKIDKDIKKFADYSAGLGAEGMGSMLYEDYEQGRRITRTSFKRIVSEITAKAKAAGVPVATDGFAPYLIGNTDYIFNLPSGGSDYMLLSETVPFLQMVLHGSVDYSDSVPGNLSNNTQLTKLQWAEKGYMPTFLLTYKNSDLLKDTDLGYLFSSDYDVWKEEVEGICKEFNDNLSSVYNSRMLKHQKTDGVAVVTYDNGKKVIVNYNDTACTVDGVTVEAMSYTVV